MFQSVVPETLEVLMEVHIPNIFKGLLCQESLLLIVEDENYPLLLSLFQDLMCIHLS